MPGRPFNTLDLGYGPSCHGVEQASVLMHHPSPVD
jgi:hypothetical protein